MHSAGAPASDETQQPAVALVVRTLARWGCCPKSSRAVGWIRRNPRPPRRSPTPKANLRASSKVTANDGARLARKACTLFAVPVGCCRPVRLSPLRLYDPTNAKPRPWLGPHHRRPHCSPPRPTLRRRKTPIEPRLSFAPNVLPRRPVSSRFCGLAAGGVYRVSSRILGAWTACVRLGSSCSTN